MLLLHLSLGRERNSPFFVLHVSHTPTHHPEERGVMEGGPIHLKGKVEDTG